MIFKNQSVSVMKKLFGTVLDRIVDVDYSILRLVSAPDSSIYDFILG